MFVGTTFSIGLQTFKQKLPPLRKKFSTWNSRKTKQRQQYSKVFSAENWKKLPAVRKAEYSLMNCQGCFHRYPVYQSFFPVCSKEFKSCSMRSPIAVAHDFAPNMRKNSVSINATRNATRFYKCQQAAQKFTTYLVLLLSRHIQ